MIREGIADRRNSREHLLRDAKSLDGFDGENGVLELLDTNTARHGLSLMPKDTSPVSTMFFPRKQSSSLISHTISPCSN